MLQHSWLNFKQFKIATSLTLNDLLINTLI